MTGTLTSPMARSSLRFVPETPSASLLYGPGEYSRSPQSISFSFSGRNATCKASLHAAVAEPAPVLETMRRPASLYEVLRVNRNASPTEIKKAYRSLAKVYHPDASDFKEDGRDFIEIHNAYATLSDPAARALYDMSLGRRPFSYSTVGTGNGYYPTQRWETDQCW